MKRSRLNFVILIFVSIVLAVFTGREKLFGNRHSSSVLSGNEFELIENAIIIHGITEEEPEEIVEDDKKGKIIYDNQFEEAEKNVKKVRAHNLFEHEFNLLCKKDIAWHLTPYTIRKGDNLWSIARRFKTNHQLIIKANNITNPDMLSTGKTIIVPNKEGVRHTVKRNETLTLIANLYKIPLERIRDHNNIKGSRIIVGSVLFIPDAKPIKKIKDGIQTRSINCFAKKYDDRPRKAFYWPVEGKITSSFGNRISPISGKRSFHTGLDIGCPANTPIKAAADGKVIFSGWKEVYGNMIILKHADGYITVYGHNHENLVKEGDVVKAKDIIAKSGTTGASTGPHLHFEIRKYLTPLNPIRFLR